MMTCTAERLARAYLLRVAEPPAPHLTGFVAQHGPVDSAERVRRGAVPEAVERETGARREVELARTDLEQADRQGARLVIPEDDEWPAWPLLALQVATGRGVTGVAPPLALWIRGAGRFDDAVDDAIAIVGARAATAYGEHTAADLAYELASRDVPVLSGAAYGIDGAAHRGALAGSGITGAVLACGLDGGYPAGHVGLLNRIAEQGLVVSEYPPGTPPARHRFLVRNRLLAALAVGTVIVEAGARSGAKNTATTAGVLGKAVMAIPGSVGSAMSVGCHQLIRRSQAILVTSTADVLDTAGSLESVSQDSPDRSRRRTDELGPEGLRVYEVLARRRGKSPETIARESGITLSRVRALLPTLELDGFSERCESGWRRAGTDVRNR